MDEKSENQNNNGELNNNSGTIENNNKTVNKLRQGSFSRDIFKVISGSFVAQLFSTLASPILSRLFLPSVFGISSVFTSIANILYPISCLRYEAAIVHPDDNVDAVNLAGSSLFVSFVFSSIAGVIIFLFKDLILEIFKVPELRSYLWLLPITIFSLGVNSAFIYWCSRYHKFGSSSLSRVIRTSVKTITSLLAGFLGYKTAGGLILGFYLGISISTIILGGMIWFEDKDFIKDAIAWYKMKKVLKRYKKFPFYDAPAILLNTASWQLPTFILSYYFSSTIVGYYDLGFRLLSTPMDLIGTSISQAFYPQAMESYKNGTLKGFVKKTFYRLILMSSYPMIILMIIGKEFFSVIFGSNWAEAGVYVQILSIWLLFWFLSSPMSQLFRVLEKQEFSLKINILNFTSRLIGLLIGGILNNPRLSIALFALSGIITYGYLSISIIRLSGVSIGEIYSLFLKNLQPIIPLIVVLGLIKFFVQDYLIILGAALLLSIFYYLYIIKTEKELVNYLLQELVGSKKRISSRLKSKKE